MACSDFIEPLDLRCILLNIFAGSVELFIALSLFFFAGLAAYFKMPNVIFFVMIGLFLIIMGGFAIGAIWTLIFLSIGSLIFFWILKKIMDR